VASSVLAITLPFRLKRSLSGKGAGGAGTPKVTEEANVATNLSVS
jgi:hypothetical protein